MRLVRRILSAAFVTGAAACGSDILEPGTLTVTLSGTPPALTNQGTVQVTGQVTRTPAAPGTVVTVSATGGANAVNGTAAADGSFTLSIGLSLNATNQVQVTATDSTGSSATPASFTIRHDGMPPMIASSTPANLADGVVPATISFVFSEPVRPGGVSVAVTQQGVMVPGATGLSTDSITLTFTPTSALAANAIHAVTVSGAVDAVGNSAGASSNCFATGGAAVTTFTDEPGVFFQSGSPPATLVPPDVMELRFARTATMLYTMVEFDAPRTLTATANNNVSLWLDFDLDQDGGTGFVSLKDTVFAGSGVGASGAGVEYMIEMGTLLRPPSDSGFVAMYTAQDSWNGRLFRPSLCGALIGFAIPFSDLGDDDGLFDVVMYVDAFHSASNGAIIDPAPDTGVFSATITASATSGPAAHASALMGSVRRIARPVRLLRPR